MCKVKFSFNHLMVFLFVLAFTLGAAGCPAPPDSETESEPESQPASETGYSEEHPANHGHVHGVVFLNGAPQAFGMVQVLDLDGNFLQESRSTPEGTYEMRDFVPGPYLIRFLNSVGNQLGEDIEFEIKSGRDISLDLKYTY